MKWYGKYLAAFCVILALSSNSASFGAEQTLAFVRGLQEKGYADVSVEYLKWLRQQPNMPAEIADVFDLEMSKSLRGAANTAFNAEEAQQMTAEAQKYLDKFLKEKPDHPDAVAAMVSWGTFSVDQALQLIRASQGMADKTQQAKQLAEARKLLEEARPRYQNAILKYQERVAKELAGVAAASKPVKGTRGRIESKAEKASAKRRAQIELDWLDARFRLGLIDYYVGQTYTDPKSPDRIKSLKAAAEVFDDIYQANRVNPQGQVSVIGLSCHMWHGKTMEDLGDLQTAEDIYDEVLANADPAAAQSQANLEPLFAQVAYFRMLIFKRKNKPDEFVDEAKQWLQQYRTFVRYEGYQGIALETAKSMLELAEKSPGGEKTKLTAEARELLSRSSKFPSQYQQAMIMLARQGSKTAATDPQEIKVFDEAVALGNESAKLQQWANAITYYDRAVALSKEPGPRMPKPERVTEVRGEIVKCKYMQAWDLFGKDKYQESLDLSGQIVRDSKDSPVAPAASELAVKAAFGLYSNATPDKREAARDRLIKVAQFTLDNWPGKPEADGVRILLGQVSITMGKADEGMAMFEKVNPRSERYPVALHMLGHNYWVRYLIAKSQPTAKKEQLAADREKAYKYINDSLEMQRKALEQGKPMPQQMIETQLELADMKFERGEAKAAVELYQPLVDAMKSAKPQTLDLTTLRIFLGAIKAYVAVNDLTKASETGLILAEEGEDNAQVNGELVKVLGAIDGERRKAEQTVANPTSNAKDVAEAKARIPGLRDVLTKLLKKLVTKQQHAPAAMLYIADTSDAVGMTAEAKGLYQKFLDQLKDEAFAKTGAKYETRARAQLIGLLRKEGNAAEAMNQVEELIKVHPRALEFLLQKGMILQSWAEKDASQYDKTVAHWTDLRNKLQPMKKKPPQYYEVVLHLGECLVAQAAQQAESDKAGAAAKAKQAEQLLKSTITLSPTLGGRPSLVGEYNVLIDKAIVLQGRTPDKKPEAPAPAAEAKPAETKPTEAAKPAETAKAK